MDDTSLLLLFGLGGSMILAVVSIVIIIIVIATSTPSEDASGSPGGSGSGLKTGTKIPVTSNMLKKNTDPWNISGFGGGDNAISVSGDSVVYQLKKNTSGGQSGGMFTSNPYKKFPTEEARLEFDVFLPDTFPLKPEKNKMLGGKLWGFCIGKQYKDCATGGNYNPSQGSVRMTFNAEDSLVATVYVYPPASSSDDAWKKQGKQYQQYGHATNKGHKLFLGKGKAMPLKHGWNSVSLYVKLNTPGNPDGIIRSTVNGVTNEVKDANLRHDASIKMISMKSEVFLGGSGKEWEIDRDVTVQIANVHIST